ncbi:MAG: hypothetical protein PHH47_12915 [Gallionella sp.]|nr:hypothetical protein [Gallionella sp.]MDD4947589.1 hypothetical protein [Gallionella sp.]MDD5613197.1 hypothetical protein [Gallionella sp.]
MKIILALCVGFLIGRWVGWISAHQMVANECHKLGGFFVGDSIFKCVEVIKPQSGYPSAPPNPHRKEGE